MRGIVVLVALNTFSNRRCIAALVSEVIETGPGLGVDHVPAEAGPLKTPAVLGAELVTAVHLAQQRQCETLEVSATRPLHAQPPRAAVLTRRLPMRRSRRLRRGLSQK